MKLIITTGIFKPDGEIVLHPAISDLWEWLGSKNLYELPPGTPLNIEISLSESTLLSGEYGIVWATYDLRQAETIHSALLAQQIASSIGKIKTEDNNLLIIKIEKSEDIVESVEYIWKGAKGLRLIPDWKYPEGTPNTSFEKWLNG